MEKYRKKPKPSPLSREELRNEEDKLLRVIFSQQVGPDKYRVHTAMRNVVLVMLEKMDLMTVYQVSRRLDIRKYFFDNNIWYHLLRIWYPRTYENMIENIEPLVPQGKHMNYLWVLLAHHIAHDDTIVEQGQGFFQNSKLCRSYAFGFRGSAPLVTMTIYFLNSTTAVHDERKRIIFKFSQAEPREPVYRMMNIIESSRFSQRLLMKHERRFEFDAMKYMKCIYNVLVKTPGLVILSIQTEPNEFGETHPIENIRSKNIPIFY